MLRKALIVLMAVLLLGITGCQKKKEYIVEKNVGEILEMLEKKQDFVLFCGTATCETCAAFRPILEEVCQDYELTVYYLDVTDYESAEIKELTYNYLYRLEWTPSVYVIKQGRSVALNENDNDTLLKYGTLLKWLEEYHAIP